MARTVAALPAGSRITDYISLGVVAKFFPVEKVREVLQATDRASGTFTRSMSTARYNHQATLLPNGRVLVTGGFPCGGCLPLNTAEIYDPATGVWSLTGSMAHARSEHTANLLKNGKVLVAGGCGGDYCTPVDSAELYDPTSGSWSATGSMNDIRASALSAALPSGKILVNSTATLITTIANLASRVAASRFLTCVSDIAMLHSSGQPCQDSGTGSSGFTRFGNQYTPLFGTQRNGRHRYCGADPVVFTAAPILLAAISLLACYLPVRKANQRVKYYQLTPAGKRQLHDERSHWKRMAAAIAGLLHPEESEGRA